MPETKYHQRHDRHVRLAAKLTTEPHAAITSKFIGQRVLLTGDARRLGTVTGRLMFRAAANLIVRFCPKIDVALPPESSTFESEIISMLGKIDSSEDAEFRTVAIPSEKGYAVTISIGGRRQDLPNAIVIDSEGWLAIIGKRPLVLKDSINDELNPFGALMAAALGAAEVFKYLLRPAPGKAFHFEDATFSTFDYSVNGNDTGPNLPNEIVLPDSLLVGVGAVGNAFLLSLSNVTGLRGDLTAVDGEVLDDPSNLNRYVLAFESDIDPEHPMPKTDLAARLFEGTSVQVHPFQEKLDIFVRRIYGNGVRPPNVVLSAVDNNEARLVLQHLWPDLLLEGATDDSLSQVSRHEYDEGLACLLCVHDFASADPSFSYVTNMAGLSGLTEEAVKTAMADASLVITSEHVEQAMNEKRAFLSARVGIRICSVFSELEKISSRHADELPAHATVSFVSMISGLLMAAELVKYAVGLDSKLETFFNIDSMFPLSNAALQRVAKVSTCYCSTRRTEIEKYREERSHIGQG